MGDDWDADFSKATIQPAASIPSGAKPIVGHSVGRGRGYIGKAKETASFGTTQSSNGDSWNNGGSNKSSTNGGWNTGSTNNNDWDESGGGSSFGTKQFDDQESGGWNSSGGGYKSSGRSGGGGGGGGVGGGGRNMDCRKCGETGHMARDCPSGGGGQRSNACFKCGEEGHMSRECPKSGSGGGDSSKRACFKCGDEGHMSRECPKGGGSGGSRACFKCGEEGHQSRDCPNGGSGGGDSKRGGCYKCGEDGHISRDCPNGGSGGGDSGKRGGSGCFKCGEEGHMSRDCPSGGGDGPKKSGCFKCGEEGHMSKECPNPQATRTVVGEDGKPREIYVPPDYGELEDDDTSVPTGINFEKYFNIKVEVSGNDVPKPVLAFSDAGLSQTLIGNIERAKYTKPTPVQKYTIPIVKAGRDLMACAQTGSGKTAAFLLPMIQRMFDTPDLPNNANSEPQEPWAVIVSPTRELAIQIELEAARFSRGSIVKVALIYGGTAARVQGERLMRRGCHILVATPGRLDDFLKKGWVSFSKVKFFVLDEADRMLDMGFGPAVRTIVEHSTMPDKSQRQTLLFSATFPDSIQTMAAEFLKPDYLFLRVGLVGAANTDVTQTVLQVDKFEKKDKLLQILKESGNNDRTMVFVETKRSADFVASFISQKNFLCTSIHGDRLQREREEALNDFRLGRKPILTATAVAARGLDIKDVQHVINYDMPSTIEEYVHRIGRTGRVGNIGRSTSFFDTGNDAPLAKDLVNTLSNAQQEVPDWLVDLAGSASSYAGGGSNFTSRDVRKGTEKSTWQDDNVVANGEENWD